MYQIVSSADAYLSHTTNSSLCLIRQRMLNILYNNFSVQTYKPAKLLPALLGIKNTNNQIQSIAVFSHTRKEAVFAWDCEPNGHLSIHSVIAVPLTRGHHAALFSSSANINHRETRVHSGTVLLILSKWTTKDPNNVYWATCTGEAQGKDSEACCFVSFLFNFLLKCFFNKRSRSIWLVKWNFFRGHL